MSLNVQPNVKNDSQLLNFNMENISHELDALIIGGELDGFGTIGTAPTNSLNKHSTAYGTGVGDQLNSNLLKNVVTCSIDGTSTIPRVVTELASQDTQMVQGYLQHYYQQQLNPNLKQKPYNIFQHANCNKMPAFYNGGSCAIAETPGHCFAGDLNNLCSCAVHQLKPVDDDSQLCTCIVTGGVSLNHSPSPKYEFHFLRCQSAHILSSDANTMPLISSASRSEPGTEFYNSACRRSTGGFGGNNCNGNGQRKFMKQQADAFNFQEIDYGNVVIDMSTLALSADNKEHNPVLRLFGLFRKMHYYLNAVKRESFVLEYRAVTLTKCSMPCTMNVQYQVKQVSRKCTLFFFEMQGLINTNKIHSLDLYLECEQSLNRLRTLLTQVETFRRIEMEHKRGQFVTEEARAQSEKLEQHLEELSDQIRETHIFVYAFNWAVERTNHQIGTAIKSNVPLSNSIPPTICDNIPNEINVDVRNNEGTSGQLLHSPGSKFRAFPIITVNCGEFDIERQSTRYIGYK